MGCREKFTLTYGDVADGVHKKYGAEGKKNPLYLQGHKAHGEHQVVVVHDLDGQYFHGTLLCAQREMQAGPQCAASSQLYALFPIGVYRDQPYFQHVQHGVDAQYTVFGGGGIFIDGRGRTLSEML